MVHNTNYYGGEIINLIHSTLGHSYSMNRGWTYIWVIGDKIVFCDLKENNYGGCLEVHEDGQFKDQLDYNGILVEGDSDFTFPESRKQRIVSFLNRYKG